MRHGAILLLTIRVTFEDAAEKTTFEAEVKGSTVFASFADVGVAVKKYKSISRKKVSTNISWFQE